MNHSATRRIGWGLVSIWATVLFGVMLIEGGTLALSRLVLHLGAAVLAGAVLLLHRRRQNAGITPGWLWIGPIAFFVYILVSLIPLPVGLLRIWSPNTAALWQTAHPAFFRDILTSFPLGREVWHSLQHLLPSGALRPLSVFPEGTLYDLLDWGAVTAVAAAVAYGWRRRAHIGTTLDILVTFATVQALFGLIRTWTGWAPVFLGSTGSPERASGSFYNANHFVDFLGIIFPIAVAVWLVRWRHLSQFMPRDRWGRIRWVLNAHHGGFVLLTIAVGVILLGIVFSRSRGGISATLLVLAWMVLFPPPRTIARRSPSRPRSRSSGPAWHRPLIALVLCLGILVLWAWPIETLERFRLVSKDLALDPGTRVTAWWDALRMWIHFPIFGVGVNAFGEVFPRFQSFTSAGRWGFVHNEWLQMLVDTGIIGMLLLLGWLLSWVGWWYRHPIRYSRMALWDWGCRMGLVYFVIDSMVDLNFRIPANTLVVMTLMGLRFAMRERMARSERHTIPHIHVRERASRSAVFRSVVMRIFWGSIVLGGVAVAVAHYTTQRWEDTLRIALARNRMLSTWTPDRLQDLLQHPFRTSRLLQYSGLQIELRVDDTGFDNAQIQRWLFTAWTGAAILNPQDYISRSHMATLLWRLGQPRKHVVALLRAAIDAAPREAVLWYQLGVLHWIWGEIDPAVRAFRRSVELQPEMLSRVVQQMMHFRRPEWLIKVTPDESLPDLAQLAFRHRLTDVIPRVMARLEEIRRPDLMRRLLPLMARYPDRFPNAAHWFAWLQIPESDNPEDLFWYVLWQIHRKDWSAIQHWVPRFLAVLDTVYPERAEPNIQMRFQLAAALHGVGLREMARSLYLEITHRMPHYAMAYRALARLDMQEKQWFKAYQWLQNAPRDATTCQDLLTVARALVQEGHWTQAQQVGEWMLQWWQCRHWGYYSLALLYAQRGHTTAALEMIRSAMTIPKYAETIALLAADLEAQWGDSTRALQIWLDVLDHNPRNSAAYQGIVRVYSRQGRSEQVKYWCARAREQDIRIAECPD